MVSKKRLFVMLSVIAMLILAAIPAFADDKYSIYIQDNAELLSESDMKSMTDVMLELSEYGNVLFYSCDGYGFYDAAEVDHDFFGNQSATVFYINMERRVLTIYVNGLVGDKVSTGKCDTIADNVYKLASKGEYAECAKKAFSQVLSAIKGEKIAAPMQLASNICLAVIFALLINYGLVVLLHGNRKPKTVDMLKSTGNYVIIRNANKWINNTTRRYSPRSKSSGGGGGGFGGGGHGGSHGF